MVLARLDQEFLTSFGENAFGGDICTVSEFRNKGDWNLCDKFYTYFNNETFEQFYSGEVEDDIIHRDRLLRSYPKEHSVKMLRSMHNALIDFYDYYEPDVCVAKIQTIMLLTSHLKSAKNVILTSAVLVLRLLIINHVFIPEASMFPQKNPLMIL